MGVRRETTTMRSGKTVTRWRVDVTYRHPDGRKERVAKVAQIQTRRGAEQEERDIIAALQDGTYNVKRSAAKVPTFAEFQEEYFANYVSTLKPSGNDGKRSIWEHHILPVFGRMPLDSVTPRHLAQYIASRSDYAPKTVNNHLSALRQAMMTAAKWRIIERSAIPEFEWLRVPDQAFDFLTYDDARALVQAGAEEKPWGPMIAVGLLTGMRLGELRALQWTGVDLERRRIIVSRAAWKGKIGAPKNNRHRTLPVTEAAGAALDSLPEGEFVFTATGDMLTKEQCKWPLWRACDRAGVRRIGWHVLRHTFASHLAMRGAPVPAIQALMGHSSIKMTMRYSHMSPSTAVDAISLLDQGLQMGPGEDADE